MAFAATREPLASKVTSTWTLPQRFWNTAPSTTWVVPEVLPPEAADDAVPDPDADGGGSPTAGAATIDAGSSGAAVAVRRK